VQSSTVTYTDELQKALAKADVTSTSRPMDGQPDLLYNVNGMYSIEDLGLTLGLFYNLKGETYVSGESWSAGKGYVPNIVELPVGTLDGSISKRFLKHWQVGFTVKNILDPVVDSVYRSSTGYDLPNTSYRIGRTFGVTIGCDW